MLLHLRAGRQGLTSVGSADVLSWRDPESFSAAGSKTEAR
jgi:hypothetical protein